MRPGLRALLVTRNFPPLRGGMERLNAFIFTYLWRGNDHCALVGPAGSRRFAPDGARVLELPVRTLSLTVLSSIARSVCTALRLRPEIVLAGSGLMAPAAVVAASVARGQSAVYLHGLDIIAPSRLYRWIWWPCIRRCGHVLVNSANTRKLAVGIGIDPGRISIVHPGTELPMLDPTARGRFRARLGVGNAPLLLSVGRLTARKGMAEFVEHALPAVVARHPAVRLIIIGDQAPDALSRGKGAGYDRIRAVAEAGGIADSIVWLGYCTDEELNDAYQGVDLHIFPVRDIPGDVEGFGMVAIEAAARGLSSVAFDVGGVSDAVCMGENGVLVNSGDYSAFSRVISDLLEMEAMSDLQKSSRARAFAERFSWDRFGDEMILALRGRKQC